MSPESLNEQGLIVSPVPGRPTGIALAAAEQDTLDAHGLRHGSLQPPNDFSELYGFAEELLPAHVVVALRGAERVGDIVSYRYPSSRWRRYDKTRPPGGLLVVGDAVCSFNPIYGQGMTVAALHALALRECLSSDPEDLPRRFFRAAAKPTRLAWQMAVGGDLALPEVPGTPALSTRLFNRYADRVLAAAEHDVAAFEQFVHVAWLVDSPLSLLRPSIVWRAVMAHRRLPGRRPVEALSCCDNGWVVEVQMLEFYELGPFPTGDDGPSWPMEGPPLHRLPFSVINGRRTLRPDPVRPLRSDCQVASNDLCRSKP